MIVDLMPHPAWKPKSIDRLTAELKRLEDGTLSIDYIVHPPTVLVLPDRDLPWRRHRLWESTCFELFVRPGRDSAYTEFNFAPHSSWNTYDFKDWRRGMSESDLPEPHIVDSRLDGVPLSHSYRLHAYLDALALPEAAAKVSVTAVLEEHTGQKSYWALAHPPGDEPNFHHAACFAASLPPIARS